MIGIDIVILQVMRERETFDKMYPSLPVYALEEKTGLILQDYKEYFKQFDGHTEIDPATFRTLFFSFLHPSIKDDLKVYYDTLLDRALIEEVDDDTRRGLTARILELDYATKIANITKKYDAGEDIDIARAVQEATETLQVELDRKTHIPWVQDSIHDLLKLEDEVHGLKWRLPCINHSMRPLRSGDFGLICARPDAGKTSFLTSELTYMASQLPEGKQVVWLNNESLGQRIVTRLYQSALDASISELKKYADAGTIEQEYIKQVGALDTIRVLDIHDCWNYEVSDILQEMNPGLVVFDMIDNVRFGGLAAGSRTDQALEAMYQWARVLGVRLECPILATSQISAEGDGLSFPQMHMLKDSKTGKQGAADFIMMLGRSHEPMLEHSRFISLPKNKLIVEDGPKDPRAEVLFDYIRGRFREPEVK
jgi:replicative DNA helicase